MPDRCSGCPDRKFLNEEDDPLVRPVFGLGQEHLQDWEVITHSDRCFGFSALERYPAELSEAVLVALHDTGCNRIEISIVTDQYRPCLLGGDSYKWVSRISGNQSTAKLACVPFVYQHVRHGFRHVLVKKEMHSAMRSS